MSGSERVVLAGTLLEVYVQDVPIPVEYVQEMVPDFREDVDPFDIRR